MYIKIPAITRIFLLISTIVFFPACGESEAPKNAAKTPVQAESNTPAKSEPVQKQQKKPVILENEVIYQEEIYKNWPYTEAPDTSMHIPDAEAPLAAAEPVLAKTIEKKVKTAVQAVGDQAITAESEVDEQVRQVIASSGAKTHTINAEARVFNPDIVYIKSGDTVGWTNMTSHNTVSIEGIIPGGATPWQSALGENLKLTLEFEGVYAYVCQPHIGFGMVGVIVVGQPKNLDEVKIYADKNLQGPYRRIIGKLNKVTAS